MTTPEDHQDPLFEPTPRPRRRRGRLIAALLVVVLVLGTVGYFWARQHREAQGTPGASPFGPGGPGGGPGAAGGARRGGAGGAPIAVGAATVREGKLDVKFTAIGTVIARNVVTVHPRVDGLLLAVKFTEGQTVKAGDVIAQIDPKPFEITLANANGQLQRDQALLANANADVERYRTLLGQDSIAKQQVDTQESLVHQYQGTIATDKAAVDDAKLQLDYTHVTAPIGGRVGLRQIDAGNMVHGSDVNGLVVITEVQPISTVFSIPQDQLPAVLKSLNGGAKLRVEAWDREDKNRLDTGTLVSVDNQIDTTSSTVKIKAEFPNADLSLFPNQFVNIKLVVSTIDDAVQMPAAAVQRGAPGIYVYVVDEATKTVSVRVVKLGPADGERVQVLDGLKPGDRVVIDGTDRLREGASVDVVDRSGAPQQARERRRGEGKGGDKAADGKGGDAKSGDAKAADGKTGEGRRHRDGAAPEGSPQGVQPGTPPAGSMGPGSPGPGTPAQGSSSTVVPGGAAPSGPGSPGSAPAPSGTPPARN